MGRRIGMAKRRAQTAIEYIMLVGAVIFIVIVVFMLVKANVFNSAGDVIDNVTSSTWGAIRGILK